MHRIKLVKNSAKKKNRAVIITVALILTVQAICLCCVSVASAGASSPAAEPSTAPPAVRDVYEEAFNEKVYSSAVNRARWLKDLMDATGERKAYTGTGELKDEAVRRGVVSSDLDDSLYTSLDRAFVCDTLCRAMDYPERSIGYIKDISIRQSFMSTAAYYGYFIPDEDGMIYPEAAVGAEEYSRLLEELSRYRMFKGKSVLAFGDSIMYGTGNEGFGIAKMIAEKYGMTCTDYSVPGQTMGINAKRGHIPDQIRKAVRDHAAADIILINGGTNDTFLTKLGDLTKGYDMSKVPEQTFTGGFERAMWLIKQNWDAPVVYVRAHNMELSTPENEQRFGERGLEVARKWGANGVDLYTFSGLNTEDPGQRELYTYLNPKLNYTCDSIHPNALGYAKYYLPMVGTAVYVSYTDSIFPE